MLQGARWAGVITVVYSVYLTLVFPPEMGRLPAGMRTPIIAFELARRVSEVEGMFGAAGDDQRQRFVRDMDAGNRADFGFLVSYGAFFVLFSGALLGRERLRARIGMWLCVVPSLMDVLENLQLLAITKQVAAHHTGYESALFWLGLFTWLKWLGIAVIFAVWIPALWSRGAHARVVAGCAGLTCLATVSAFFVRGVAAELMALGVGLTVLSALTFTFRRPRAA